jgi:hypothetical protein
MRLPLHGRASFYKYYTAEAAKATLSWATRKWSTPSLFNDPFDNQFELRWEEPSQERARGRVARFHEIVRSPVPIANNQFGADTPTVQLIQQTFWANPDFEFTDADIAEILEGEMEGERNVIAQIGRFNADLRQVLADTSIFCVSDTDHNILLWSHYASNHTGVVVELLALQSVDSPLLVAQPVRYSSHIPRLTFDTLFDQEDAKREIVDVGTLTKSDAWAYEREWRVVTTLRDKAQSFEIIPFAREEVATVYLGCRITPEDRAEIIGITRLGYPRAKILQATKHEHEFALTFHEVG